MSEPHQSSTRRKQPENDDAEVTRSGALEQAKKLIADLAVKALREGSRENGDGG
jgi:hypothetical protein